MESDYLPPWDMHGFRASSPPALPNTSLAPDAYVTSLYSGVLSQLEPGSHQATTDIPDMDEALFSGYDPGREEQLDLQSFLDTNPQPNNGLPQISGQRHLQPSGTRAFEQLTYLPAAPGYSPFACQTSDELYCKLFYPQVDLMQEPSNFQSFQDNQDSLRRLRANLPVGQNSTSFIPMAPSSTGQQFVNAAVPLGTLSAKNNWDVFEGPSTYDDGMEMGTVDGSFLPTSEQLVWKAGMMDLESSFSGQIPRGHSDQAFSNIEGSDWHQDNELSPPKLGRPGPSRRVFRGRDSAWRSSPNRRHRPRSGRPTPVYKRVDGKESGTTVLPESQGEFGELRVSFRSANLHDSSSAAVVPRIPRTQDACIRCRAAKKRCEFPDPEGCCRLCRNSGANCVRTNRFLPIWGLPSFFLETSSASLSLLETASASSGGYEVTIYLGFGSNKLGAPLSCRVVEDRSAFDGTPRSSMIWENLWSPKTDKNCVQNDRLASCFIPARSMPSAETILEWAVNSVQRLPSGIIENIYGPLYTFASNYIRLGSRPLHNLMSLVLIHTALYNVCHSKMTIVFDKRQKARISLPLRLRAQICRSLFELLEITGVELHRVVKKSLRHSKKERLAFSVANMLLMLTYEHCLEQISKEPDLDVFESDLARPNFAERKQCLEGIVKDLRSMNQIVVTEINDLDHQGFEASWKGRVGEDDDRDLKNEFAKLQIAIVGHQTSKDSKNILGHILSPHLYPPASFKQQGYIPMSDTLTVSTSKKVDFDNMSVDTWLSNKDGDQALSGPQAIQKVLQNLKNQNL